MDIIAWLSKDMVVDPLTLGGKAASLVKLVSMGMPVPPGFCLTTRAYDAFIAESSLSEAISTLLPLLSSPDLSRIEQASEEIAGSFRRTALPTDVEAELSLAYNRLSAGKDQVPVAVRSSATAEDLAEASFAGQHDTFLNVRSYAGLVGAVKRCWASFWSARAIHYRLRKGIAHSGARMAVVVQRMVDAEASAVTFTSNPVSGQGDQVLVNCSWGLGEAIVSGLVTPDSYVLGKEPLSIQESCIEEKCVMVLFDEAGGTKEVDVSENLKSVACLSDDSILANARLCLEIERRFGYAVDVESAFSKGQWYILQARPITT